VIYSIWLIVTLAQAWRESQVALALACGLVGFVTWSATEYLVHRYVLHVAFPPRRDWPRRLLHHLFDASHADHHARPWDGYHINGHLDTLLVAVWLVPLSLLAPTHTASVAVAVLFAAYVAEEWAHHAFHFCNYPWPYFQYLRRRHLYHHSPHGRDTAFGITSGVWDRVFGTRIPRLQRERLRHGRPRTGEPPREATA